MTKAELIEEIVSYVYTNGRGEITGANLQDVLVDMVNILGAAAFLGVGSVQDGDTGVVTGDAVYDALTTALSNYVPTSRKVNNHALTADITLTLDDIGDGVNRVLNSYFTEADGVVRLKNDYSYFKPRLGLIFDVNSVQNTPAELMKVNVGTEANPVYALKSTLPFFSESWISAGGVSSGGGQAAGNASMQLITGGGRITNGTDTLDVYSMSNTYTKQEVNSLIGSISGFKYEIYASLGDITHPSASVLYLIGPTGSGADKYEEYVYSNSTFVKIGDTSIDLSGYATQTWVGNNYQPLDADLTAIAGLSGTSGLLKKTAANTWTLDTNTYLTGNQTITLSGDVSGSGATSISVSIGAGKVTNTMLAGSIENSKLVNSSITIGSTAVSLGGSITNLAGIGTISMSGALTISTTKKIYFGDTNHYVELDSNGYFHFSHGLYSDSFVSAGGISSGGGTGGIDLAAMWASLQNNDIGASGPAYEHRNDKFHLWHMPTAGTGISYTTDANNLVTGISINSSEVASAISGTYVAKAGDTMTGTLAAKSLGVTGVTGDGTYGLSLYGGTTYHRDYGIWTGLTSVGGTHGSVTGNFATYFTMSNGTTRGWIFQYSDGPTNVASISTTGVVTASSYVKTNGTSSQFLKADGSVDSSAYLTGNQTITLTGVVTGSGATSIATSIADGALSIAKTTGLQTALDGKLSLGGGAMNNTNLVTNLDADLLDGLHASGFLRNYGLNPYTYSSAISSQGTCTLDTGHPETPDSSYNTSYLTLGEYSLPRLKQLAFCYDTDNIYYRRNGGNGWTSWVKLWNSSNSNKSDVSWEASSLTLHGAASGVSNIDDIIHFDTINGRVGIGASSPSNKLDVIDGTFRVIASVSGNEYIPAKFLTYTVNPYGIIIRGMSDGTHTLQCQREGSVSELFALCLQPLGGNVGIGTTSPGSSLDVCGASSSTARFVCTDYSGLARIDLYTYNQTTSGWSIYSWDTGTAGGLYFANKTSSGDSEKVTILHNGNVGIGTNSPQYALHVSGDGVFTGAVTAGSASDISFKSNIKKITAESAKSLIMAMNPVTFTWNSLATSLYDKYVGDDLGLVAQEVEPYLPMAISPIFEKYKRLDYTKLIAPIIRVEQDHETRIQQLERESREKDVKIAELENTIANLTN